MREIGRVDEGHEDEITWRDHRAQENCTLDDVSRQELDFEDVNRQDRKIRVACSLKQKGREDRKTVRRSEAQSFNFLPSRPKDRCQHPVRWSFVRMGFR